MILTQAVSNTRSDFHMKKTEQEIIHNKWKTVTHFGTYVLLD